MSDCSYAAMSNHKLTVANLCVKSNSMWTNFADNGKIHTCMYNVCTMYVQCIPRQLAWFYHGSWRVFDTCSVRFAHTAHASLMGAYAPKRSANRAWSREGQRLSDNIWAIVHMLFVGHERERLPNVCSILIFYVCNEWRDWAFRVCAVIS